MSVSEQTMLELALGGGIKGVCHQRPAKASTLKDILGNIVDQR